MLMPVDTSVYVPAIQSRWLDGEFDGDWMEVEGSLLFADVTGFTALSERLARRGRAGAEELTDVINAVVGGLFDAALPRGGDLLKFGGDAVLFLFTGDGHEQRAAAAAFAMQTAVTRFGRAAAVTPRTTPKVSIGVDAGRFFMCLAGSVHHECVIGGSAVTGVVELEGLARGGQTLIGPTLAVALPASCLTSGPVAQARRLRQAPPEQGPPEQGPSRGQLRARPSNDAIPAALRPHLGTSLWGEHRRAAIGFLHFDGVDDLLATRGPDATAAAVGAVIDGCQRACAAHGVTFLATDVAAGGGKVVMVAGAPATSGDDEDRLVAAIRAVLEGPRPLPLRAGINHGRVFAAEIGTEARRAYTVMGDAVNVAARLMAAAREGACLAASTVTDRLTASYRFGPPAALVVKGRTELVAAKEVGPAATPSGPQEVSLAQLVGRDRELRILLDAMAAARAGHGSTVDIVGPAGIGKSRLVAEALARTTNLTAVVVRGAANASTTPYLALRDPLRHVLGARRDDPEDAVASRLIAAVSSTALHLTRWLPLVAAPFGVTLPDTEATLSLSNEFRRDRLYDATAECVAALVPESGVLVIEDAHWLDEGSAGILLRLVQRLEARHGWLSILSRRRQDGAIDSARLREVTRLELGPLTDGEVKELISAALPDIDRREVGRLVARAGGSPLFAQELTRAAASGAVTRDLPDTVEALIAVNIDTLGPRGRTLLRVASVLGDRFPSRLLERLVGSAAVDVAEACAGLLVAEETEVRFRHEVIRQVAYEGLPYRQRREFHAQAAEQIEASADDETVAPSLSFHYLAAGRYREAWRWSLRAAETATSQSSPVEAVTVLDRALEAARHVEVDAVDVARARELLGDACERIGLFDRSLRSYRLARRDLGTDDPARMADLMRKEGWLHERAGRYSQALRAYTRAGRVVAAVAGEEEKLHLRARLRLASGAARIRQGRHREALPLLEEALHVAERIGERRLVAHAHTTLDWALTELGRPEPDHRERALPIYVELDDWQGQGSTLNNLGLAAYYEGRWTDAVSLWSRSREAFERSGDLVQQATAANNIGEVLADQGHLDTARQCFEEALETWRDTDFSVGIGIALSNLGRTATRRGDTDHAGSLLADAICQLREIGAAELACEAEAREAERRLILRDADAAERTATGVRRDAHRPMVRAQAERIIGYAHALRGDAIAARQWFDLSLDTASSAGVPYEEALTRQAIGDLNRLDGAEHGAGARDLLAEQMLAKLGVVATCIPSIG